MWCDSSLIKFVYFWKYRWELSGLRHFFTHASQNKDINAILRWRTFHSEFWLRQLPDLLEPEIVGDASCNHHILCTDHLHLSQLAHMPFSLLNHRKHIKSRSTYIKVKICVVHASSVRTGGSPVSVFNCKLRPLLPVLTFKPVCYENLVHIL